MVQAKTTQEFVPIREIRDGIIILRDNSLRLILMVSSLNFSLKSTDEQEAIIAQYQNFLNSLDFPVQFFIESRKLEIGPYISSLEEAEKAQVNELLQIQTKEYIEFIKNFVRITNVVSKTFYAVVSYSPSIISGEKGVLGGITGVFSKKKTENKEDNFEENRLQLQQRANVVQQGLNSAGVRAVPLNTDELIELFYRLFNPSGLEAETISSQPMAAK